jgi:hypothetical protein
MKVELFNTCLNGSHSHFARICTSWPWNPTSSGHWTLRNNVMLHLTLGITKYSVCSSCQYSYRKYEFPLERGTETGESRFNGRPCENALLCSLAYAVWSQSEVWQKHSAAHGLDQTSRSTVGSFEGSVEVKSVDKWLIRFCGTAIPWNAP